LTKIGDYLQVESLRLIDAAAPPSDDQVVTWPTTRDNRLSAWRGGRSSQAGR
jgi:hypothetical protein